MPFCPKCGGEYRSGFTRCVDCGVPLAEHLPGYPEPKQNSEPPVAVYETRSQAEAGVLRAKLEFFGIAASLSGDLALRGLYDPMGAGAFGGALRILVPAHQAEEAREILDNGS